MAGPLGEDARAAAALESPGARAYAGLCAAIPAAPALAEGAPPDERALQALWASGACVGKSLALATGEAVEILEVGRRNGAMGPDFRDALVVVGSLPRRGDVELHLHPNDWDLHRHAGDGEYANLVLHVTWFARPSARTLPPGVPSLALEGQLAVDCWEAAASRASARVSIEEGGASARPCTARFAEDAAARDRLLADAGRFRLQTKARILLDALRSEEAHELLYAGLLRAMGYGRNAEGFCRLARELPFRRIAPFPPLQRFAVLAAHAGLLPMAQRALWDLWWQSGIPPPMTPYVWDLRAMRPQNHPFRRLAGFVGMLGALPQLAELPPKALPEALCRAAAALMEPLALAQNPIGRERANAIVNNLFVPYRLALGRLALSQLPELPGESVSMPMREAWFRLSGRVRALPRDGLRQQGLLQLYADFCGNPAVACADCPVGRPRPGR